MVRPASTSVLDRVPATTLDLRVLGPVQAAVGGEVLDLGYPRQRAVLFLLALRDPDGASVDGVIDGIWGESPPPAARASVYSYVSNLRALLGGGIERRRNRYVLTIPFRSDARSFEEAVETARTTIAVDAVATEAMLRDALATWRGLPYCDLEDLPVFGDEARRLEELRLQAVELRIESELRCGRGEELVPELRGLVSTHPLHERFRGQLMLALYRSGRQAEALREYERTRRYLVAELGIEPSPELGELELKILQQDEGLVFGGGQVTTQRLAFLFTDIEESARHWDEHGGEMARALSIHDDILRSAVEEAGGAVSRHTGNGAICVFSRADAAALAAERAQRAFHETDWSPVGELRIRMAIDVGDVDVGDGDYRGPPLNRCARIVAAGHGGQVLLSSTAFDELSSGHLPGVQIRQLGPHRLRGLAAPERLAQLVFVGLPADFPELRTDTSAPGLGDRLEVGGLPGYEIRERLGTGTWGAVYRAYQPAVGREVAVRVIPASLAGHPAFVRRFESLARAVAHLEHPHIVPLHDFWRDHEGAYLVMQLMRGGSLARAMRTEPWQPADVARLLDQVGLALAYAHAEGAVHGDLRPENILLDGRGNAYVSDFGLDVRTLAPLELRRTRTLSPHLAPEIGAGEALDARADVFSLGVLAWALLAGDEPPAAGPLPRLPTSLPGAGSLDTVLLGATTARREERFDDVATFIEAFRRAIGADETPDRPPVRTGLRNPYKGLRAFSEADAGDFFGRSELVGALVDAVGSRRLVAVVGPSGSGKSSAVRAGLIPRLRAGALAGSAAWFFVDFTPGPRPLGSLGDALRPLATRPLGDIEGRLRDTEGSLAAIVAELLPPGEAELLMVVDQFEELYTLASVDERTRLVARIAEALDGDTRIRLVLTLRADFYDRPLADTTLAGLVAGGAVTVLPPTVDELLDAIERPALGVGLAFEPGLPMRIARDVVGQPGGLPLLQYALTEMVEHRAGDLLTGIDYDAIGTIQGAVARRAEAVFSGLEPEAREAARSLMLRLVTVDGDTHGTRRRVRLRELEDLGRHAGVVTRVLDAFGTSRLLSFDRDPTSREPTVEIAHESLLDEWTRLREWIVDERERLVLARRLRAAMAEWQDSGHDSGYLLSGSRLAPFRQLGDTESLSRDEREFLERSIAGETRGRAARRRRRRATIAAISAAAVIATALAGVAFSQGRRAEAEAARAVTLAEHEGEARQEAEDLRARAEEQAALAEIAAGQARQAEALATARELAASALGAVETDPQLAILLALEAISTQPAGTDTPVELRNALRRALHDDRLADVVEIAAEGPDGFPYLNLIFGAGGGAVAVDATGSDVHRVYSTETRHVVWESTDPLVSTLAIDPAGDRLLLLRSAAPGAAEGTLEIVTLPDGDVVSSTPVSCRPFLADWSPDASLVAVAEQDCDDPGRATVRLYETSTGVAVGEFGFSSEMRMEFASGPDGPLLLVADWYGDPGTRIIDVTTGDDVQTFPYGYGAISPDGTRFLGMTLYGEPPTLYDVESGAVLDVLDGLPATPALHVNGELFSPDSRRITIPNESSRLPVWSAETGALELVVPAGMGAHGGFGPDADTLVTAADGRLKVWDLSPAGEGELESAAIDGFFQMHGIQASDSVGVAWSWDPSEELPAAWLFDPSTGALGERFPDRPAFWPAPAGHGVLYQAIGEYGAPGPIRWWDASTGEIEDLDGCWPQADGRCPDGSPPLTHLGMWSSADGEEAGLLMEDGRFRVWRNADRPAEEVRLDLGPVEPMYLLMGFGEDWVMVRTTAADYDVFDRRTGELRTSVTVAPWIRFSRSGRIGIGSAFTKTLRIVSTDDWSVETFTADLGEGIARGVAISPSGDRVAIGVMDGFVRVFDTGTATLLDTIPVEGAAAVLWIDEDHIAVGTRAGLWTVLTLDTSELEQLARDRVARDLTPNECALYRIDPCPSGG